MTSAQMRIARLLPEGGFVRNVTVLAGGAGLGQGLLVLASPILTRIYDPVDFGTFAVFSTILGVIVIMASANYERAIPLPDDDVDAANLLALALILVFATGVLATLLPLLLRDEIVQWTSSPTLRPYLCLLPLGVLASGSYQAFNFWSVRKKSFGRLAASKLSSSLSTITVQLSLGVLKLNPLGLLMGQIVGHGVGGGMLLTSAWRGDAGALKSTSRSGILKVAGRYRRFALFTTPAALLTTAWLQFPALIFAVFYGPEVAGWFALGQLALGAPVQLLADSVGQVYLGEAAKLARTAPIDLYRLFLGTAGRLFGLGLLPLTFVAIGGPELFTFVFGPSWAETGLYVQVLSVMFLLRFTVVPISNTLSLLERQDLALALSVVRFIVNIGILFIAGWSGISPTSAVLVYSISMGVVYIGHFFLMIYAIRAKYRIEMQTVNYLGNEI
jgi:O-antigen/teichoic acid export membrane protein